MRFEPNRCCLYGALIVIITLFNITNLGAAECFSYSPTYQPDSKAPPPVKPKKITRTEHDQLYRFLKLLEGSWKGDGEELFCRGNPNEPMPQAVKYVIKAKSDVDYYGNFKIEAELYAPMKKTTSLYKLELFLTKEYLRAESDSSAGDIDHLKFSSDSIHFRKRLLQGGRNFYYSPMSRGEVFTTLRLAGKNLEFIRTYYTQGRCSEIKKWSLQND